ncbi:MAG: metallophosphoesterase family protein [Bryobacter sp.]
MLEHAAGQYDEIVCCGDLVGYGARPNEVAEWCAGNLRACVRGNHDKVATGLDDMEGYNLVAMASLEWTRKQLTSQVADYLRGLPRGPLEYKQLWLMHGSPIDEDLYLVQECDAYGMESYLPAPVGFFGHTHRQGGFSYSMRRCRGLAPVGLRQEESTMVLSPASWYLINPGSVGQPRDGDPRASYAIYEPTERLVRYCRVHYDIAAAAAEIRKAGLPDLLARRLESGR